MFFWQFLQFTQKDVSSFKTQNSNFPKSMGRCSALLLCRFWKVKQEKPQSGTCLHKISSTRNNTQAKAPLWAGHAGGLSLEAAGDREGLKYLTPSCIVLHFTVRSLSLLFSLIAMCDPFLKVLWSSHTIWNTVQKHSESLGFFSFIFFSLKTWAVAEFNVLLSKTTRFCSVLLYNCGRH